MAWRDTSSSNGDTAALVIYDSNADNIMGPVHYGGSNPTSRERTGIERLASGDLVTTYQDGNDLYFQRWDGGSLDAYGSPVKINTGDGLNGRLAVQALDDGGFLLFGRVVKMAMHLVSMAVNLMPKEMRSLMRF